MDSLLGNSLGRYRLDTLLGEGGMGAVFKAYDITLQRYVALKIMHQQYTGVGNFRERFLQEARTAARLDHPGIVQVHDFGQEKNLLYIVMEFIQGANLQQMLNQIRSENKWLPLTEGIELLRQISLAVDYFHQQGVLHRDLKPANVMLKPVATEELPYRPVITDLGLAKLLEGEALTQEGTSMGTPSYMSPEQAMGEKVDARSDVYSLGILLYELAVGQLPFPIKSLTEAIRYHTQEPPPPPRTLRPDLPPLLERLILKALEKDPARRIPNAAEMAKGLRAITPHVSQAAASPTLLDSSVSLITQYQQSLLEPRGKSILEEFAAPSNFSLDQIQVLSADQQTTSITVSKAILIVGRDPSCDIALNDQKASRNHARIEFDGVRYRVTDLGSTNGTYFEDVKILPGISEDWTPEKPLRIGNTYLRLLRADASASTTGQTARPGARPASAGLDPARLHNSIIGGRASLYLPETLFKVDPGGMVTIPVSILNQGNVVDHFQLSVDGFPPSWLHGEPPTIQLMPGGQQQTGLIVQPPHSHRSRAGVYPLTLRAISRDNPKDVAEAKAQLTVGAFTRFTSDFHPQRIRAGRAASLTIQNQGNQPETFQLTWRDRGEEVIFDPPETKLTVAEGQSGIVNFTARPRRRKWLGPELVYPFTVQVKTALAEAQSHNGEVVSHSRLPAWLIPALLTLCFLLAAVAGSATYYAYISGQNATATVQAMLTDDGFVVQQLTATAQAFATQQAALLTANAAATAQALATQQTATAQVIATSKAATAQAAGDEDQDGLSNVEETELGTLPGNPDTDGDGLLDGVEVNQLRTNPRLIDTDGDTLTDGYEVNTLRTDPLNKDTDGDGSQDNVDDDPLHSPENPPSQLIPDGQLAFVSNQSGAQRVYISSILGGADPSSWQLSISTMLPVPDGFSRALWPDWCDNGRWVVYEIGKADNDVGSQSIYVVDTQSPPRGSEWITLPPGYDSLAVPRCSPARARIYFSARSTENSAWHLWEYQLVSGETTRLTSGANTDIFLAASTADWGAFMRKKPGDTYLLALLNLNTSQTKDWSIPGFVQMGYPSFDLVSGKLVFACRQTNWDICVADQPGSNPYQIKENVTLSNMSSVTPVWSPDGKWIAFASNKLQEGETDWDIWLFSPGSGTLTNLTSSQSNSDEMHPSWSKP